MDFFNIIPSQAPSCLRWNDLGGRANQLFPRSVMQIVLNIDTNIGQDTDVGDWEKKLRFQHSTGEQ